MAMPYVEIHSDAPGPYLLLVHGFLSSRAQWRANLAGLREFCRPVIVELWGHGRSPTPENADAYSVRSYIEIFEKIRQSLGVEHWLICGQSFGAGLTIQYALAHPDRIFKQIFTNSISALSAPGVMGNDRERVVRAAALEAGGTAAIEALPFHPRQAERFAPHIKQEMIDDAALISPTGIANAIRFTSPELSVIDRFADIDVPTLLMNGVWEKAFQPLRNRAVELLPSLQVVDVEVGHSVNVEAPALFNEAVGRFIRNLAL
ncbi:MAG: alpha/beta fold hydrolase [Pseudomonadota bacterium]